MADLAPASVFWTSDVHWRPTADGNVADTGPFGRFLSQLGQRVRQGQPAHLYILGDLFDFWLERRGRAFSFYDAHLAALRQAVQDGVQIAALYGNRDFLYDVVLQRHCGVAVLGDRAEAVVDGRRVLMHHGDLFCTRDRRYQIYRRIVRSRLVRGLTRLVPMRLAVPLILRMQRWSRAEIQRKPSGSMDVIDEAIAQEHAAGYDVVICGHVHRPTLRQVHGAPQGAQLVTLGAWDAGCGWYATLADGQARLHAYP